jgi:BirA family biotin operon repressor/biotin-[acetyl-CoA-carboxylase] ligase
LIDEKPISLPGLETTWLGREAYYLDSVGSTMTWLKEREAGLSHGAACIAAAQTAGRGRLGREWVDIPSLGLPLSFLLKGWEASKMTALPLVTGLAVSRAVERVCGAAPGIQWSNDLVMGGKKLCGILYDGRSGPGGDILVSGIGVNCAHSREQLDALGLVYATSLFLETGKKVGILTLAAHILNEMEPVLEEFRQKGFAAFRADYSARCVTLGREVLVTAADGGEEKGVALEVSEAGNLVCSIGGRVREIRAGEVSVRGLYGYV